MNAPRAFDSDIYKSLNTSREAVLRNLFCQLRDRIHLETAVDVGCGLGHFSSFLDSLGLHVTAVDGRSENAAEGQRRHPNIKFIVADVEHLLSAGLASFDLVLCFGLLYHLENPFRAIRNLYALTGKLLLVESMCAPGSDPGMQLLDEYHAEDQGLNYVAFYPTESCLVKMLYRAGFPYVYSFVNPPAHVDFSISKRRKKARTMLVASKDTLQVPALRLNLEPTRPWDIWSAPVNPLRLQLRRLTGLFRRLRSTASPSTQASPKT